MEKKKLTLKKETIEVLNQNEMSKVYGGVATDTCTGFINVCNTVNGCDSLKCSVNAVGCGGTIACVGGSGNDIKPYVPGTKADCVQIPLPKDSLELFCQAFTKSCVESIEYCWREEAEM